MISIFKICMQLILLIAMSGLLFIISLASVFVAGLMIFFSFVFFLTKRDFFTLEANK
jgi:hypothetical protein